MPYRVQKGVTDHRAWLSNGFALQIQSSAENFLSPRLQDDFDLIFMFCSFESGLNILMSLIKNHRKGHQFYLNQWNVQGGACLGPIILENRHPVLEADFHVGTSRDSCHFKHEWKYHGAYGCSESRGCSQSHRQTECGSIKAQAQVIVSQKSSGRLAALPH